MTENPNNSGLCVFFSQVMRSLEIDIPETQAFLALCFFICSVAFVCMLTRWLLELQPSHLSSVKEETPMAIGFFRKAHPAISILETRIVLENVVISRRHFRCHQNVGSFSKEEKKGY